MTALDRENDYAGKESHLTRQRTGSVACRADEENEYALRQMKHVLQADTRRSTEIDIDELKHKLNFSEKSPPCNRCYNQHVYKWP